MVNVGWAGILVMAVAGSTATGTGTATATATPAATPTPTPAPSRTGLPELSLPDALGELERQNLTLAQARARANEVGAATRQAWSVLLPSVTANGNYTRNSDEAIVTRPPPAGGELVIQPLESFTVSGAVRVPLLVPNGWFDVAAARKAGDAAEATAGAARAQVRALFAQAAFGARAAEEIVIASERAVENASELARSAERRVAAGTAPPLDALRARTEAVRRESDLARARAELERARLGLGILLGREGAVRVTVPAEPPPAEEETSARSPEGLVSEALASRPELAAQRAQVEAAEARIRSAWARLAPQLSASGSAFASDVAYPTGEKDGWRATLDLSWPIYDGGLRHGGRREAEARLAGARAAAEAQRLAVVQEVSDAARDVAVARERLRLAETQRRLASDAAASARRSFEAGVLSSLDVVDANDRLYAADTGLAEARARVAQARVALERAAGRG